MKQVVVLLAVAMTAISAWTQDDVRWDYQKLEKRVRTVCTGANGNWILRLGHPNLTLRSLYRNWTAGEVFTESILSPETSDHLMSFTQTHMSASDSCYEVSSLFLNYELMGFEALNTLRRAFKDSGITENCEHTPADEDLRTLYLQCSKIEFNERYVAETGASLVFSQNMIAGVRKRMANKWLIERRPKTCAEIEELDEDIYRAFTAAQRMFRKRLKSGGYVKSAFGHDWS